MRVHPSSSDISGSPSSRVVGAPRLSVISDHEHDNMSEADSQSSDISQPFSSRRRSLSATLDAIERGAANTAASANMTLDAPQPLLTSRRRSNTESLANTLDAPQPILTSRRRSISATLEAIERGTANTASSAASSAIHVAASTAIVAKRMVRRAAEMDLSRAAGSV